MAQTTAERQQIDDAVTMLGWYDKRPYITFLAAARAAASRPAGMRRSCAPSAAMVFQALAIPERSAAMINVAVTLCATGITTA